MICDERAGGVHAVLAGDGLERGQLLERRLAQAFVAGDVVGGAGGLAVLVDVGRVDGHDLALEAVLAPTPGRRAPATRSPKWSQSARVMPHWSAMRSARLELGRVLVLLEVRLRQRAPGPVRHGDAERDPAHRLDAARHRDVDHARPTSAAARLVACCDEPHWASTVVAAALIGQPGRAATRCGRC